MTTNAPKSGTRIGVDRFCCYMGDDTEHIVYPEGCPQPAEWEIIYGQRPDEVVDACDDHAWKLITDAPEHIISSLNSNHSFRLVREDRGP